MARPPLTRAQSVGRKTSVPNIPTSFDELDGMTELQLEKLSKDEIALKSHVSTMSMVTSMREIRDELRTSNYNDANKYLLTKVCTVR